MAKTTAIASTDAALPLFAREESSLRCDIVEKRLGPGAKLPSGAELEAAFGVSRITVRHGKRWRNCTPMG